MTTKNSKLHSLLLVLTAFIWGVAFVAQSKGGEAVGPFTFNTARSVVGCLALLPVIKLLDAMKLTSNVPTNKEERKLLLIGGICCGLVLGSFSLLQQVGLYLGTPAGKAGFLTACYIVMVPILGIFLKKKCKLNVWIAVALTLLGLYLLCMQESFSIQLSDALILACSFLCAVHILAIDYFKDRVDVVRMSCLQFAVSACVSFIPMVVFEILGASEGFAGWYTSFLVPEAWISILYAGILSSGVAYTLQMVGQQKVEPTLASILMSLESVFSVLAGALILHETLLGREMAGCGLIFVAVILAQLW